jgi:hypothetical protein
MGAMSRANRPTFPHGPGNSVAGIQLLLHQAEKSGRGPQICGRVAIEKGRRIGQQRVAVGLFCQEADKRHVVAQHSRAFFRNLKPRRDRWSCRAAIGDGGKQIQFDCGAKSARALIRVQGFKDEGRRRRPGLRSW